MADGGQPLRVLCLEDSLADAELLSATLTRAGHQVDFALAPDRRRFEELLAAQHYDIILADFALPGFDAHGALELVNVAYPGTRSSVSRAQSAKKRPSSSSSTAPTTSCSRTRWRACRSPCSAPWTRGPIARRWPRARRACACFLAHAPVALFAVDHTGVVTFADGTALSALGLTSAQVMGRLAYDFFPEVHVIREGIEHTLAEEPFATVADIAGMSLDVRLTALPGHEGAPAGVIGVAMDITERRHAVEALELSAARLRRTVEGAVEAMGAMIAARDPYTAGHEKRVTELAVAIATEMGGDGAAIKGLRLAGLVHNVGKLTVPAEILNKPSLLTAIEFELIKGHAAAAQAILKPIDFEYPVADIVSQHHERQDGSGYPAGLKGDGILPEARVLAVADVVEAMASHRPYRAALGLEAALAEVHAGAGTRYESAAVTACERVFERGFVFTDQ